MRTQVQDQEIVANAQKIIGICEKKAAQGGGTPGGPLVANPAPSQPRR